MSGGCTIRFDEHENIVIEDIPDNIMAVSEQRAAANGRSADDEVRELFLNAFGAEAFDEGRRESPLPRGRGLGEGVPPWLTRD